MLYAGLKFTGLALNVAGGLAKAVRQDAERMMKELEADAAAKVCHNFTSLITIQSKVLRQGSNSVMQHLAITLQQTKPITASS